MLCIDTYVYVCIIDICIYHHLAHARSLSIRRRRRSGLVTAPSTRSYEDAIASLFATPRPHGFYHFGDLVHERYRPGHVVQNFDVPHLLPGHREVLEELIYGMGHVL